MTYYDIKVLYERNKSSKDNTYLVPIISFDGFFKDELMFVEEADEKSCTVFRAMDGKFYNLTKEQIKKFKCVGRC